MTPALTRFESRVMEAMLDGDGEGFRILRAQLARLQVVRRTYTGVGFYAEVYVPPDVPRLSGLPSLTIGDVTASAPQIRHGLGFVLFIREGAITVLEGYTHDEPWPEQLDALMLAPSHPGRRLMDGSGRVVPWTPQG